MNKDENSRKLSPAQKHWERQLSTQIVKGQG